MNLKTELDPLKVMEKLRTFQNQIRMDACLTILGSIYLSRERLRMVRRKLSDIPILYAITFLSPKGQMCFVMFSELYNDAAGVIHFAVKSNS